MFWKFSVMDNGKGIPEQYHKTIFDMFRKLENNANSIGSWACTSEKNCRDVPRKKFGLSLRKIKGQLSFLHLKKTNYEGTTKSKLY